MIFVPDSFPHLLCVIMRLCFSVLSLRRVAVQLQSHGEGTPFPNNNKYKKI